MPTLTRRHTIAAAALFATFASLLGCDRHGAGGGEGAAAAPRSGSAPEAAPGRPSPPATGSASAARPADIDALKQVVTGGGETAQMPPSHPPIGGAMPGMAAGAAAAAPAAVPGEPFDVADIRLTAPASWRASPPSSSMRRAQFEIAGTAGPAEAVVYFFGTGQGGGVKDNIDRWIGQFTPTGPPLPPDKAQAIVERPGVRVTVVRARGTYSSGMGMGSPVATHEGYALVGLILESPGGPVFVKMTGPMATIDAATADVDALVQSIALAR